MLQEVVQALHEIMMAEVWDVHHSLVDIGAASAWLPSLTAAPSPQMASVTPVSSS